MLNLLTAEIQDLLTPKPAELLLIITIGNVFRRDDGVGSYLAGQLKLDCPKLKILDAKDKPENIIEQVAELSPRKIVIVDAADFGGRVGEVRIIPEEKLPQITFSTHAFPLAALAKIIAQDTQAPVYFLGIQPKDLSFGEGMSSRVKRTADEIISFIRQIAIRRQDVYN